MTTQTGDALAGFDGPDSPSEVSTETTTEATESQQPEGEVDWQAKYEEEAAARVKAENDLKSQRNGRLSADQRQQEVIREIRETREETARLRRQNEALMNAVASGETENLPQQMEQINQDYQVNQDSQKRIDAANRLYGQIIDAVTSAAPGSNRDEKEAAAIRMIETQPEFREVLDGWSRYAPDEKSIDLVGLSGVVAQTTGIVASLLEQKSTEAVRQAEARAAERLEEADVLNLDAGGSSAPANISDRARNERLADPDYIWTEDDMRWWNDFKKRTGIR